MSEAPKIEFVHYDSNCPILDREQIEMLIMCDDDGLDLELARELFDLFNLESEAKLETLPGICAMDDRVQLRNIVHFIAGSAGNLGLVRLTAFYRAIERALDKGRLVDISNVEPAIRREFEIGREAFYVGFNL